MSKEKSIKNGARPPPVNRRGRRAQPVEQLSILTERVLQVYPSSQAAAAAVGTTNCRINKCLNRRCKSVANYFWRYQGSDSRPSTFQPQENPGQLFNRKAVHKMCLRTKRILKTYRSIKAAAVDTGILNASIGNCIHGRTNSAGGFLWRVALPDELDEEDAQKASSPSDAETADEESLQDALPPVEDADLAGNHGTTGKDDNDDDDDGFPSLSRSGDSHSPPTAHTATQNATLIPPRESQFVVTGQISVRPPILPPALGAPQAPLPISEHAMMHSAGAHLRYQMTLMQPHRPSPLSANLQDEVSSLLLQSSHTIMRNRALSRNRALMEEIHRNNQFIESLQPRIMYVPVPVPVRTRRLPSERSSLDDLTYHTSD